jgi:hypothetical protein
MKLKNRKSRYDMEIIYIHNQWCMDNGYPIRVQAPNKLKFFYSKRTSEQKK